MSSQLGSQGTPRAGGRWTCRPCHWIRLTAAALAAAVLIPGPTPALKAQSVGATIVGTVRDASGALVPKVTVAIRDSARGVLRAATTNQVGNYVVPALLPGGYEVTAEKPGFRQASVENVVLEVNQTARIDFLLEVGPMAENITVESSGVRLESESSAIGQVVHPRQIVGMPLNGRNFIQLGLLSAGVAAVPEGGLSSPASSFTNRTNSSLIINGNRESDNSWLVDGVETRGPWMGITQLQPSVDAIQEFKIQRLNYPAEFGMGAGVVNIVLKTGTNQFHGALYEFLRNDKLDARGFFDANKIPALRQNQWGASLGGPILRDRTYFFAAYEGLRRRRTETIRSQFPADGQLNGDFRDWPGPVFDPLTGSLVVCGAAQVNCPLPFPGNVIPSERLNHISKNIAAYWPRPNLLASSAVNHQTASRAADDFDQFNVRLDHRFSAQDEIFGRYSYTDSSNNVPGAAPLFGALFPQKPRNLALSHTHIFRPSWLNEFRFGYNRTNWSISLEPVKGNLSSQLGFKNLEALPPQAWGLPFVNITGFFSGQLNGALGPPVPETHATTANSLQFVDHMTMVKGSHTIKMGFDIRREGNRQINGVFINGVLIFAGVYSGNPLADYVLGLPLQFAGSTSVASSEMLSTKWAGFIQDDFRVTPNITLNLGLRYDYFQHAVEANDNAGLWENGRLYYLKNVIDQLPPNLQPLAAADGVTRGIVEPDRNNFAPRVGFAIRPFGNSKTVVRGAYGMVYVPDAGTTFATQMPPFLNFMSQFNDFRFPVFTMDQLMPDPKSGVPLNLFTETRRNRDPYIQQWNFTIQREAFRNTLFELAYAGQASHKLWKRHNANQAVPGITPMQMRTPFPSYGEVVSINNESNANYHALQTRFDKTFSNGFSLLASYTWSKSIDYDSGVLEPASTQSRFDRRLERAPSDFDVPQRFVGSFLYDLPFGPGKRFAKGASPPVMMAVAGWQISGITTFSSGTPFYVSTTTPTGTSDIFGANRANRVCNGNLPSGQRRPERWFDTSCFVDHGLGEFGNAGRNILRQDGIDNWDLSMMKHVPIREKVVLQFRTEFFNAFNRTHFARPGNLVSQPLNFGVVTQNVRAAGRSREIQFGLKLLF